MSAPVKRAPRKAAAKAAAPAETALTDGELAALSDEPAHEGPIGEDGQIRPVQIGKRGRKAPEMVTIFTIDDVDYKIPAKPSPAILIKFMREARNRKIGRNQAVENLLVTLLGQEALDALAESPDVTEEDVADVFTIVGHIGFGAFAKLQGASGN